MFRRALLSSLLLITWACTTQQTAGQASPPGANTSPLVFLTRGMCVNTDTMRERLDDALKAMSSTFKYAVVDQDTLAETDARQGYPTPTLLYENKDIFGLPEPERPFPEPT